MNNIGYKHYFDILFLIINSSLAILVFLGQIVFVTLGLIYGISDWGIEGVLAVGLGVFGLFLLICILLVLFGGLNYWRVDDDGVANGGAFKETKILFNEAESYIIDYGYLASAGGNGVHTTPCFRLIKGKKNVIIPLYCLSAQDLEWLQSKIYESKKV